MVHLRGGHSEGARAGGSWVSKGQHRAIMAVAKTHNEGTQVPVSKRRRGHT